MASTPRTWSLQQQAVFQWFAALVAGCGRHLVVRARAGTGKTTTIIEALSHLPEGLSALLCAFNKRIATELTSKLAASGASNAEAKTLHSAGFAEVKALWGAAIRPDDKRGQRLADTACGGQFGAPLEVRQCVTKLAGLAKGCLPLATTAEALLDLAYAHGLLPLAEVSSANWKDINIAGAALKAMTLATEKDGTVDFDDMVYVPVRLHAIRPRYDVVVVDEAQDMNAAQLLLAQGLVKKGGSIVVVGDDRQAIYGFRGADSGSIDRLKGELSAQETGLTTTYRCPKAVVALAQQYVSDFNAADSAPAGEVKSINAGTALDTIRPGDYLLSRKNAPLMGACLALLVKGVRAKVEGRDVGYTLKALVNKLNKQAQGNLDAFHTALKVWLERELLAAKRVESETKAQLAEDKAECLRVLASDCGTVADLLARLDTLFADSEGADTSTYVVCSSIHKAKGLEARNVYVLADTLFPGGEKAAKKRTPTQHQEECNLAYVAYTRAMNTLLLVSGLIGGEK